MRHWLTRARVPSGVMAMQRLSEVSNLCMMASLSDDPRRRDTGMPPMALNRYFMGKKNHASFIRKPALRPSDDQANLPSTKSQLDV